MSRLYGAMVFSIYIRAYSINIEIRATSSRPHSRNRQLRTGTSGMCFQHLIRFDFNFRIFPKKTLFSKLFRKHMCTVSTLDSLLARAECNPVQIERHVNQCSFHLISMNLFFNFSLFVCLFFPNLFNKNQIF